MLPLILAVGMMACLHAGVEVAIRILVVS